VALNVNENVLTGAYPFTLGKGSVFLRFDADPADEYIDLGNAVDFNVTLEVEEAEVFLTKGGIDTLADSAPIKQTFSGNLTLNAPNSEAMKIFLSGSAIIDDSQTGGSVADEVHTAGLNKHVFLGKRHVSVVVVKDDATKLITYVEGTDYTLNKRAGALGFLEDGTIVEDEALAVSYTFAAVDIEKIEAGSAVIQEAHILFEGEPIKGNVQTVVGFCTIIPNGEIALIGNEFQSFAITLKFIEHPDNVTPFSMSQEELVAL